MEGISIVLSPQFLCDRKGDQTRFNSMFLNNMLLNMLPKRARSPLQLHLHGGQHNQSIRPPPRGPWARYCAARHLGGGGG